MLTFANINSAGTHKVDNVKMLAQVYHDLELKGKGTDLGRVCIALTHLDGHSGGWKVLFQSCHDCLHYASKST